MSKLSNKQIEEAFQILGRYEQSLREQMVAEIVERREEFENPFGGAEALIRKYYNLLGALHWLRAGLEECLPADQRRGPLARDEFRCFRCRSIIRAGDDACPKCGWTWG